VNTVPLIEVAHVDNSFDITLRSEHDVEIISPKTGFSSFTVHNVLPVVDEVNQSFNGNLPGQKRHWEKSLKRKQDIRLVETTRRSRKFDNFLTELL
jgi:hypothetical protein